MNGVTRMTRGLDQGFRQKFENFLSFQFLAKSACKIKCLTIFWKGKKKSALDYKNKKLKKAEDSGFFQRG